MQSSNIKNPLNLNKSLSNKLYLTISANSKFIHIWNVIKAIFIGNNCCCTVAVKNKGTLFVSRTFSKVFELIEKTSRNSREN